MIFHNHFEVNLSPNGTGPNDFPKVLEVSILSVLLTLGFQTEFRWSKLSIKATTLFFVLEASQCEKELNERKYMTAINWSSAFSILTFICWSVFALRIFFAVLCFALVVMCARSLTPAHHTHWSACTVRRFLLWLRRILLWWLYSSCSQRMHWAMCSKWYWLLVVLLDVCYCCCCCLFLLKKRRPWKRDRKYA